MKYATVGQPTVSRLYINTMIEYIQLSLEEGLYNVLGRIEPHIQIQVLNGTLPHQLLDIFDSDDTINLARINYTRVSTVEDLLAEVSKLKHLVIVICELQLLVKNSIGLEYRVLNQKLVQVAHSSRTNQMFIIENSDMPFIKMLCI